MRFFPYGSVVRFFDASSGVLVKEVVVRGGANGAGLVEDFAVDLPAGEYRVEVVIAPDTFYIDVVAGVYYAVNTGGAGYKVYYIDGGAEHIVDAYFWDLNTSYIVFRAPITGRIHIAENNISYPVLNTLEWFTTPSQPTPPNVSITFPAPWSETVSIVLNQVCVYMEFYNGTGAYIGWSCHVVSGTYSVSSTYNNALTTIGTYTATATVDYGSYSSSLVSISYSSKGKCAYWHSGYSRFVWADDLWFYYDGANYYRYNLAYDGLTVSMISERDVANFPPVRNQWIVYIDVTSLGDLLGANSYPKNSSGFIVADNGNEIRVFDSLTELGVFIDIEVSIPPTVYANSDFNVTVGFALSALNTSYLDNVTVGFGHGYGCTWVNGAGFTECSGSADMGVDNGTVVFTAQLPWSFPEGTMNIVVSVCLANQCNSTSAQPYFEDDLEVVLDSISDADRVRPGQSLTITGHLEYEGTDLRPQNVSGITVYLMLGGTDILNTPPTSEAGFTFTFTAESGVGKYTYTVYSVTDEPSVLNATFDVIVDKVELVSLGMRNIDRGTAVQNGSSIELDETLQIWAVFRYAYDQKPFTGDNGTVEIGGVGAAWNGTHWVAVMPVPSVPTNASYTVPSSLIDNEYGLAYVDLPQTLTVEWVGAYYDIGVGVTITAEVSEEVIPPTIVPSVPPVTITPPVLRTERPSIYSPYGLLSLGLFVALFIAFARVFTWAQALAVASAISLVISLVLLGPDLITLFLIMFVLGVALWRVLGK